MAFHERWFPADKVAAYHDALWYVPTGRGELVEVGVWEGRSIITSCRQFPKDKVHAIDHWRGDLTDPASPVAGLAAKRDVYADFMENVTLAGVVDQIIVHRQGWRETFATWDLPIRMLFIDAEHTYPEVVDNIEAARPFLVPGAVVCGDDFNFPEVEKAVRAIYGAKFRTAAAIWWHVT